MLATTHTHRASLTMCLRASDGFRALAKKNQQKGVIKLLQDWGKEDVEVVETEVRATTNHTIPRQLSVWNTPACLPAYALQRSMSGHILLQHVHHGTVVPVCVVLTRVHAYTHTHTHTRTHIKCTAPLPIVQGMKLKRQAREASDAKRAEAAQLVEAANIAANDAKFDERDRVEVGLRLRLRSCGSLP